ncbi:MAG TPA: thioesterase family protein [Anaerolineales bacterium]|jgi:acyl-CoA thioester hydrolase
MSEFHFYYPVEVRYGDLDPQGHVNNANFLTYFEQARVQYLINLGLLDRDGAFVNPGLIIAEARVTYLKPVLFGMDVRIGTGITRLGNKSMTMDYLMVDNATGAELARGSIVIVTYDYTTARTVPVPHNWRKLVRAFEQLPDELEEVGLASS